MALNRSYVGRTFGPEEPLVVTHAHVRAFAEAIGESDAIYNSRAAAEAAGLGGIVAPPTYAIVAASDSTGHPIFEPAFGMQYDRVVHGEQEFSYERPIRVGDELHVRSEITEVVDAGRNEVVRVRTTISDRDGAVVCTSVNSLVSRGTAEGRNA